MVLLHLLALLDESVLDALHRAHKLSSFRLERPVLGLQLPRLLRLGFSQESVQLALLKVEKLLQDAQMFRRWKGGAALPPADLLVTDSDSLADDVLSQPGRDPRVLEIRAERLSPCCPTRHKTSLDVRRTTSSSR